jgi:hypothetical protein
MRLLSRVTRKQVTGSSRQRHFLSGMGRFAGGRMFIAAHLSMDLEL